jgi:hypothetical protein
MFGILKSFGNFFLKSYSFLAAFAVLGLSGLAMAQGGGDQTVTATMPTISWGTLATQIVTTLTAVAVVGIGIGISIWVLLMVPRIFRRMAK